MQSKLFDLEEIDLEVAIETIGRLVAVSSQRIHDEMAKTSQDKRKLRRHVQRRENLQKEIEKLYSGDPIILRRVAKVYAQQVHNHNLTRAHDQG